MVGERGIVGDDVGDEEVEGLDRVFGLFWDLPRKKVPVATRIMRRMPARMGNKGNLGGSPVGEVGIGGGGGTGLGDNGCAESGSDDEVLDKLAFSIINSRERDRSFL